MYQYSIPQVFNIWHYLAIFYGYRYLAENLLPNKNSCLISLKVNKNSDLLLKNHEKKGNLGGYRCDLLRPWALKATDGKINTFGREHKLTHGRKYFLGARVFFCFQYLLFIFIFTNSWSRQFWTIRYLAIRQIFTFCTSLETSTE